MYTLQDNEQIEDKINQMLSQRIDSFASEMTMTFQSLREELLSEIGSQLETAFKELSGSFGDSALGGALLGGVGSILGSIMRGQQVDPRLLANSVARAFTPAINDAFGLSKSQSGDVLSGLLDAAKRNF